MTSPHAKFFRPLTSNHWSRYAKSGKRPAKAKRRCERWPRRRAKSSDFYSVCDLSGACIQQRKHEDAGTTPDFPALQLLHDLQRFGEKLYGLLQKYYAHFPFDHNIFSASPATILAVLAQSAHALAFPDALTPTICKLAHEFIHPGVGSEVVAAGLIAIKKMCRRQPWAMQDDLLGHLVAYNKSRDKGVMIIARGLLLLCCEVHRAARARKVG